MKKRSLGYTLLEVLFALGLASAAVVSTIPIKTAESEKKIAERSAEEMTQILIAARAFRQANGAWPATLQDLIDNNYLAANSANSPFDATYSLAVDGSNIKVSVDTASTKFAKLLEGASLPMPEVAGTVVSSSVTPPGTEVALDAYLPRDGSKAMTGNFDMGGNAIQNTSSVTYGDNNHTITSPGAGSTRIQGGSPTGQNLQLATSDGVSRGMFSAMENGSVGIRSNSFEWMVRGQQDGETALYYDNNQRFETTAGGTLTTGRSVATDWFENSAINVGLENSATGQKLYSSSSNTWNITGDSSQALLALRRDATVAPSGYLAIQSSNQVGLRDRDGDWAMRHTADFGTEFYDNNTLRLGIGPDTIGAAGGEFGSITTRGAGSSGFSGYSINGERAFLANDTTGEYGLFDDEANHWSVRATPGAETSLYFAGGEKLRTTASGVDIFDDLDIARNASVGGALDVTGNITGDEWLQLTKANRGLHNTATDTYLYSDSGSTWSFTGGGGASELNIALRDGFGGLQYGALTATSGGEIGVKDNAGAWAVRHAANVGTFFSDNNTERFSVGENTVTGDYGSVQTIGSGKGGWNGYSIDGNAVFMGNNNFAGLYNDKDNQWLVRSQLGQATMLYYAGDEKFRTEAGGAYIDGSARMRNHVISGVGSGGVALTINDGHGNANITFNHLSGRPEQDGNAARIEVNTDASTGAVMHFELLSGVTGGAVTPMSAAMSLYEDRLEVAGRIKEGGVFLEDKYLGITDTAVNADKLDGLDSSQFLRSDVTDTMTGRLLYDSDNPIASRRGMSGGYGLTSGTGIDWGANIWSIGDSWDGSGYGSSYAVTGSQYGLSWLRDNHAAADVNAKEGLYLYRGGVNYAAIGYGGAIFNTPVNVNGTLTVDNGTNSQIVVRSGNGGESLLSLFGDTQGSGRLYVGQSSTYGGGIEYNGDGSPVSSGAGADFLALYRTENGTPSWTAKNFVTSDDWIFRGSIFSNENQRVYADDYHPNADRWTTARTLSLGGDVSGAVSFDGSSDMTLNVEIDDDKFSEWSSVYSANVSPGWVTIGEFPSSRGHVEVYMWDTESGDHSFIHIEATRSFNSSGATVLNAGGHARRLTGVRFVEDASDTTYGNKKLQVYAEASSTYHLRFKNHDKLNAYTSFTPRVPSLENMPAGYQAQGEVVGLTHEYGAVASTGYIVAGEKMLVGTNEVWHQGNMGPGSGLNADLLDGLQGSQFLRSDVNDTFSGSLLTITGDILQDRGAARAVNTIRSSNGYGPEMRLHAAVGGGVEWRVGSASTSNSGGGITTGDLFFYNATNAQMAGFFRSQDLYVLGDFVGNLNGTLDGLDSTQFLRSDVDDVMNGNLTLAQDKYLLSAANSSWGGQLQVGGNGRQFVGNTSTASVVTTNGNLHLDAASGADLYLNYYDGSRVRFGNGNNSVVAFMDSTGQLFRGSDPYWHRGNDGAGSLADSDFLDGLDSSQFLRSDVSDTMNGALTIIHGSTIGGTNFDNGWLKLGSGTAGLAFDNNEIFATHDLFIKANSGDLFISSNGGAVKITSTLDVSGVATFNNSVTANGLFEAPLGMTGGYTGGMGSNWAGNIWGMGRSWDGAGQGAAYDASSQYGIAWVRGAHNLTDARAGEGLYVYAAGVQQAAIGSGGAVFRNNLYANTNQRVFADNYHPNADRWTTARSITLTGDASGTVSIDGSSNRSLGVTVLDDSHLHDGRYYTEAEADARFLGINAKAADSDKLDGLDSTQFSVADGSQGNIYASPPDGTPYWARVGSWSHTSQYSHFHGTFKLSNRYGVDRIYVQTSTGNASDAVNNVVIRQDSTLGSHLENDGRVRVLSDTSSGNATFELWVYVSGWGGNYRAQLDDYNYHSGVTPVVWSGNDEAIASATPNGATATYTNNNRLYGNWNDGAGSELDADFFDGLDSGQFLRSDVADTMSGTLTLDATQNSTFGGSTIARRQLRMSQPASYIHFDTTGGPAGIGWGPNLTNTGTEGGILAWRSSPNQLVVERHNGSSLFTVDFDDGLVRENGNRVYSDGYRPYADVAGNANLLEGSTWASTGKEVGASEFYSDGWFRNNAAGTGLQNEAHGTRFMSINTTGFAIRSNHATVSRLDLRTADNMSHGSLYASGADDIGLLDAGGHWAIRHRNDEGTYFLTNTNTEEFSVGTATVSGSFGTVQTTGGKGGWGGYSIAGEFVLMADGSTAGLYNDVDNEWMIRAWRNGDTALYADGVARIAANSSGASVVGNLSVSGTISGDGSGLTNVDAETLDGINSTGFQRLNYIDTSNQYLFRHRNSSNAVAYFNQTGTGDIARFYRGSAANDTAGSAQVTITNNGSILATGDVTAKGGSLIVDTNSDTYRIGADTYDSNLTGLMVRPADNVNPNNGDTLFVVRSGGGSPRLFAQHEGRTGTSNSDIYVGTASDMSGGNRVYHDGYRPYADQADTLDGVDSSQFLRSDVADTASALITFNAGIDIGSGNIAVDSNRGFVNSGNWTRIANPNGHIDFGPANASFAHIYTNMPAFYFNKELRVLGDRVYHDGYHPEADFADNAGLLDGVDSSQFLRADVADIALGKVTFNAGLEDKVNGYGVSMNGRTFTQVDLNTLNTVGEFQFINGSGAGTSNAPAAGHNYYFGLGGGDVAGRGAQLVANANGNLYYRTNNSGWGAWGQVWSTLNHGAGSGLDADTLDGLNSSQFLRSDANDVKNGYLVMQNSYLRMNDAQQVRLGTDSDFQMFFNGSDTVFRSYANSSLFYLQGRNSGGTNVNQLIANPDGPLQLYYAGGERLRTAAAGVEVTGDVNATGIFYGDGSGLTNVNAATVDGLDSSQFLRSDTSDTMIGALTVTHTGTIGGTNFNNGWLKIGSAGGLAFDPNEIVATGDLNIRANGGDLNLSAPGNAIILGSNTSVTGNLSATGIFSGDGSGLTNVDAATLNGLTSSQFARSDIATQFNVGRGIVHVENNGADNQDGSGITLRASNNPGAGSESSGTVGSIFAVRSSGQGLRLWVGQSETTTGINNFVTNNLTANGNVTATGVFTGNGSGLTNVNAETLDGLDSSQFLRRDVNQTSSATYTLGRVYAGNSPIDAGSAAKLQVNGFMRSGTIFLHDTGSIGANDPAETTGTRLHNFGGNLYWDAQRVYHANYHPLADYASDADRLDGLNSSQFLRSDIADTGVALTLQNLTVTDAQGFAWENGVNRITHNDGGGNVQIRFGHDYSSGDERFTHSGTAFYIGGGLDSASGSLDFKVATNGGAGNDEAVTWGPTLSISATALRWGANNVYHDGYHPIADFASDSDLLDGYDSTTIWQAGAYAAHESTNINSQYQNALYGTSIATSTAVGDKPANHVHVVNLPGTGVGQGTQIASSYGTPDAYYLRRRATSASAPNGANAWQPWVRMYHDGYAPQADNADTVDGLHAASFLRADANDVKTGYLVMSDSYIRMNDNLELRLGTDSDFRMDFNGTDTFFRSYAHSGRFILQGEDTSGTNRNMMIADPDGAVSLYHAGTLRLSTTNGGVDINGDIETSGVASIGGFDIRLGHGDQASRGDTGASRALVKDVGAALVMNYAGDFTGGVRVDSQVSLAGSIFVPDVEGIRWQGSNASITSDSGAPQYLHFTSGSDTYALLNVRTSDNVSRGALYANNSGTIGLFDAAGHPALLHATDTGSYFYTDSGTMEFSVGRDTVTGTYGTIQTHTTKNDYGGLSVNGEMAFMYSPALAAGGIFNDVDDEWHVLSYRNAGVHLYHDGVNKLETHAGGVTTYGNHFANAYIDQNDGSYYLDPNGVSRLNDLRPSIIRDPDDTNWYVDPNSVSRLNVVKAQYLDLEAHTTAGQYCGFSGAISRAPDGSLHNCVNNVWVDLKSGGYQTSWAENGWVRLPNGMKLAWGNVHIGDPGGDFYGTWNIPTYFAGIYHASTTLDSYNGDYFDLSSAITGWSNTQVHYTVQEWSSIVQNVRIRFFVLGY